MRAVRIHSYGGPENLHFDEDVSDPVLSPNSVLVQGAAASVNPIDWKIRSGSRQKDFWLSLPAILGKDLSGTVCAVGTGVKGFKIGDRVLAFADATYAELVAVQASRLTHLPEGLSLIDAAAIPVVALTGDQLVKLAGRTEKLLVSGALGGVGRAAVYSAISTGTRIIAGVRTRQLLEAGTLRVSDTLAIDDDDAIRKFEMVDAVIDTVGGETAAKLFAKVKDGGRFSYASTIPGGLAEKNTTVEITRVVAVPDPVKVREFAVAIRDKKFLLPIGHRLPLREASRAHILAEKGGAGKIILLTHP